MIQIKSVQQDDLDDCEFAWKWISFVVLDYKGRLWGSSITKKEQKNRNDGLNASEEAASI